MKYCPSGVGLMGMRSNNMTPKVASRFAIWRVRLDWDICSRLAAFVKLSVCPSTCSSRNKSSMVPPLHLGQRHSRNAATECRYYSMIWANVQRLRGGLFLQDRALAAQLFQISLGVPWVVVDGLVAQVRLLREPCDTANRRAPVRCRASSAWHRPSLPPPPAPCRAPWRCLSAG